MGFSKIFTIYRMISDLYHSKNINVEKSLLHNLSELANQPKTRPLYPIKNLLHESTDHFESRFNSKDWQQISNRQLSLNYSGLLLPKGRIDVKLPSGTPKGLLIFLSGTRNSSADLLRFHDDKYSISRECDIADMVICSWTWPIFPERSRLHFPKLVTLKSVEEHYEKLFCAAGSSLLVEILCELRFCLSQISSLNSESLGSLPIQIAGWSMGGKMAWYAPYFLDTVDRLTIFGNCLTYSDAILTKKFEYHGKYYFDRFCDSCLDVEEMLLDFIKQDLKINIIFGSKDESCEFKSLEKLKWIAKNHSSEVLYTHVIPNAGHDFENVVKKNLNFLLGSQAQQND